MKPSVLDPANPEAYKPSDWQVQGKHGRGWIDFGIYFAFSDTEAVRRCRQLHRYRLMRVKSAEMPDKWRLLRFK